MNISDMLVSQIKDFITGAISDSIARLNITANNLSQSQSMKIVDEVFETAFEIMQKAGDEE